MALFTAILTCRDCGLELNRAEHVPEDDRGGVAVSSGLAAGPCPNGCRSTFSDLNLNTTLTWHAEIASDGVPEYVDPGEDVT